MGPKSRSPNNWILNENNVGVSTVAESEKRRVQVFNLTIAGDGETICKVVKIGDNNLNFVAKLLTVITVPWINGWEWRATRYIILQLSRCRLLGVFSVFISIFHNLSFSQIESGHGFDVSLWFQVTNLECSSMGEQDARKRVKMIPLLYQMIPLRACKKWNVLLLNNSSIILRHILTLLLLHCQSPSSPCCCWASPFFPRDWDCHCLLLFLTD